MEHRCGERLALKLPAILHTGGGKKLRCAVGNLSSGGAFVQLPRNSEAPSGLVTLEVWLPYANPQHCRWHAWVIHQQESGVGLMFDQLQLGDVLPFLAAEKAALRFIPPPAEQETGARV